MRRRAGAGSVARAAIYLRVSSEEQARHGFSLADQEERCRELALSLGAIAVERYVDGGESGSRLERPGLEALRTALRDGRHDLVVALDPDRLARSLYLQLALQDEFRRLGVALHFVNLDWEDTPDGRLFLQMRGAIAEYEREKIRMRTYAGRRRKARQGGLPCGPVNAYGYHYDPEAKALTVHPALAAVVRELFRWAADGDPVLFPGGGAPGPGRIARALNRLGVAPARGGEQGWHANTVRQLLRNSRYVGELVTFRTRLERGRRVPVAAAERITVPVPALVERGLWERVQRNLARRAGRGGQGGGAGRAGATYLLSGLLRCGLCGRPLHGSLQRLRRRTRPVAVPYYACSGRPGCRLPLLPAQALEEAAWAAVTAHLAGLDLQGGGGDGPAARQAFLASRLADLAAQRQRLATAFRLGGLDEAAYREGLAQLDRARAEADRLAARAPRPGPGASLAGLAGLGPVERRAVVRLVVAWAAVEPARLTLALRRGTGSRREGHTPSPRR